MPLTFASRDAPGGAGGRRRSGMPALLFATVLALSALYVPQPLLPLLAGEFRVPRESAALLTTIAFLPLSLAPLVYGPLLEAVPARRMLRVAVLLLAISELLVFVPGPFSLLMGLRLLQGLLLPAILTSLMTCVSRVAQGDDAARAMAWYVAATILGGFAGRAVSGLIASLLHWRFSFLLLGVALLGAWFWLGRIPDIKTEPTARARLGLVGEVLKAPLARTVYLVVFCFFLAFAAIMNYLPFRLAELSPGADELRIGLAYSGYLMGIVASLNAVRLHRWLGGAERAMAVGLVCFICALFFMMIPTIFALLGGMFLLCGAMFLTHATATGYLNRHVPEQKGTINGLYVSFYYGGGVIGSWLPGYLYHGFGWNGFVVALAVVALVALLLALTLPRLRLSR